MRTLSRLFKQRGEREDKGEWCEGDEFKYDIFDIL
jgi:hypothetical protein